MYPHWELDDQELINIVILIWLTTQTKEKIKRIFEIHWIQVATFLRQ